MLWLDTLSCIQLTPTVVREDASVIDNRLDVGVKENEKLKMKPNKQASKQVKKNENSEIILL